MTSLLYSNKGYRFNPSQIIVRFDPEEMYKHPDQEINEEICQVPIN